VLYKVTLFDFHSLSNIYQVKKSFWSLVPEIDCSESCKRLNVSGFSSWWVICGDSTLAMIYTVFPVNKLYKDTGKVNPVNNIPSELNNG
jgi:hypothetical protein